MKKAFVAVLALMGVAFTMFPAAVMAAPDTDTQSVVLAGATEMTDTEMDQVTAGALLVVTVRDVDLLNDNRVGVQAAVNAAVGVLGTGIAAQRAAASLSQQ